MFELGPGRKFRASAGQGGSLRLEIRAPSQWELLQSPDMVAVATNALALVAAGEPPHGFRYTQDDRYIGATDVQHANPFELRRLQRGH